MNKKNAKTKGGTRGGRKVKRPQKFTTEQLALQEIRPECLYTKWRVMAAIGLQDGSRNSFLALGLEPVEGWGARTQHFLGRDVIERYLRLYGRNKKNSQRKEDHVDSGTEADGGDCLDAPERR